MSKSALSPSWSRLKYKLAVYLRQIVNKSFLLPVTWPTPPVYTVNSRMFQVFRNVSSNIGSVPTHPEPAEPVVDNQTRPSGPAPWFSRHPDRSSGAGVPALDLAAAPQASARSPKEERSKHFIRTRTSSVRYRCCWRNPNGEWTTPSASQWGQKSN